MKLDNLAVVFIGTDKYLKFLPSWYQTCEEKLVPNIPNNILYSLMVNLKELQRM